MKNLKVLSYNIHKGFSSGNIKHTLPQMRKAIREIEIDLVFLQEVQGHHERRPEVSQYEFLADSIWPHYSYGKNSVYSEGHHGNAILSKFPIVSWENLDISQNPMEKRGLLHGIINLGDNLPKLHGFCIHLNLFENSRKKQILKILERINTVVPERDLLIIAGDFNDWLNRVHLPLDEAFSKLHGAPAKTFPCPLPILPLDRVYCRGFKIQRAQTLLNPPWNRLSDHAPLLVDLTISS